jgi:hypothetical protein
MRFAYRTAIRPVPSFSLGGRLDQPRPLIDVSATGPANTLAVEAQIDSGSDETLLDERVARFIGVNLTGAPTETFGGMAAGRLVARFAQVTLRITDGVEFREWPARVGFVAQGLRRPVLGFGGFLQFFTTILYGDDEAVELKVNRLYPGT